MVFVRITIILSDRTMFSITARRSVGLVTGSVTKRFRAGYVMRPPKGWLDIVNTDYDEVDRSSRIPPEYRERLYQQQLKNYFRESNELGAEPDPQVRQVRMSLWRV
jgi:hypothetical protein